MNLFSMITGLCAGAILRESSTELTANLGNLIVAGIIVAAVVKA